MRLRAGAAQPTLLTTQMVSDYPIGSVLQETLKSINITSTTPS